MATSGTFTGSRGGNSNGPWLTLEWSRIQEDIANNRSLLRLTLKLHSEYSLYFSANKTGAIDGTSFTYSGGFSGTGTKTLKTKDVWVSHNSDGTKSQSLSASFNIAVTWSGSYLSSISVSGTAVIDTIPRASDFTAFTLSNTVLNTSTATMINYTLGRKSTSFSQLMTLKYGKSTIKSWFTSSTGSLTRSLTTAQVNTIINLMPNSGSGTLTLTMQTKSGSTNIGSSKTISEGISLNSAIKPSISGLSASIFGAGRDKTINKYVQSISKVTASFTRSAGYGASISLNNITVRRQSDNGNSQTINGNSGTTANVVTLNGTYQVIAYVQDSRGRSTTSTITITVEAYSPPKVSTFDTQRATLNSTNVLATIDTSWSLALNNPTTITVVGVDNSAVSTTHYTLSNSTVGSLNTTQTYASQSDASSYTYTITVTDSFGKKATAISTVGTAFVEFTIAKGQGVGVGKVWEQGALDVGGDAYVSGTLDTEELKVSYKAVVNHFHSLINWASQLDGKDRAWHVYINPTTGTPTPTFAWTNDNGTRYSVDLNHDHPYLGTANIATGYVSITPTADSPTGVAISYGKTFSQNPRTVVTANSTVPGSVVMEVSSANHTTTGCVIYIYKTSDSDAGVNWVTALCE